MVQKVPCPPPRGDIGAPKDSPPPLKFQKLQSPENMPLQNSPAPLKSGQGGWWGGSYPEQSFFY